MGGGREAERRKYDELTSSDMSYWVQMHLRVYKVE